MLPVRLELRNFLAYRAPAPLSFEGLSLACLSGPNGAGKSSLLDAMTWAIWGRARGKTDDEMIHMGQEEMHVICYIASCASAARKAEDRDRLTFSCGTTKRNSSA